MSGTPHVVRLVVRALGRAVVASLSLALLIGTGYGWSVQQRWTDRVVTSDVIARRTAAPEPEQPFTALLVGLDQQRHGRFVQNWLRLVAGTATTGR